MIVLTSKELLNEITKRRKALNVDAVSLSVVSDVSLKFISQLENGKKTVEVAPLLRVTHSLGIKIPLLDEPIALGRLILANRKEMGIDQITAAGMCGISPRLLSTIERGEPRKRLDKLFSVIEGFGIPVEIIV
tara:strand:+ start:2658 stop:3056 length:399 start_codon:yes stop_codon:yes gene_type:complete